MNPLIAEYGASALTLLATGLTIVATRYLLTLIKSKKWRDLSTRAFEEVKAAFLEVGNTYVKAIKDAGSDGVWTDVEKAEAKRKAIAIAKANIGKKGIKALARVFDVEDWIGNKLEAFVSEDKRLGKPEAGA